MPVGDSGRVVIEIDKDLKKDLYKLLIENNLTLKEWFTKAADEYVNDMVQPSLNLDKESSPRG